MSTCINRVLSVKMKRQPLLFALGEVFMVKHEFIKTTSELKFMIYSNYGKTSRIEKHWHRAIELDYTLSGQADYIISKKKHVIKDDEFILIDSREVHSVENIQSPQKRKSLIILVPYETLIEMYPKFINLGLAIEKCPANILKQIKQVLRALFYTAELEDNQLKRILRQGYFNTLLGLLLQYCTKEKSQKLETPADKSLVADVITYLSLNYHQKVTLGQVAKRFSFSPSYLDRMFKREIGISVIKYLKQIRLQEAVKLLISTNQTITQIANRTGFTSPAAFRKAFSNAYGLPPQKFRQSQR